MLGTHPLAAHLGDGPGETGERGDEGAADRGPPVDGRAPGKEVGRGAEHGAADARPQGARAACRNPSAARYSLPLPMAWAADVIRSAAAQAMSARPRPRVARIKLEQQRNGQWR